MLNLLVKLSLRYRVIVIIAAGVLLSAGIYSSMSSPLDVFPEFAPPMVEVQAEAPGLSSEAVEQLVTIPLESALNGLPQMTTMRSKSVQGLSSVQMIFDHGTDIFRARQMVSERVAVVASRLPIQVKATLVMPPLSSTSRTLKIGLTPKRWRTETVALVGGVAPQAGLAGVPWAALYGTLPEGPLYDNPKGAPLLSVTDISVLYKWVIEPRLRAVPGVANTSTYGVHDRQYQVQVKPEDLKALGVTLRQVKDAAKNAVVYGSAGYHDTPNQRLPVHYQTKVTRPEDLGATVVAFPGEAAGGRGEPVLLRQVATLTTGNPPFIGEGVVNDEQGPLVVIEKYPWANTLQVTRDVEAALEDLKPSLPGVEMATKIFRPASFIELALGNLRTAMFLGCILVTIILAAFLFEWRTAVISLTAIPLSLVAAVVIMVKMGGTLNTMVLAGLAIAIGEVVDDAIIDVENIVRRLRLNHAAGSPRSEFRVVLDASLEVRSAVVYASLIVAFVCLPIFFLGGVAGAFFRPLATAYILSVMASLVVALTLTPALSLWLLPKTAAKHRESPVTRGVRWVYRRFLPFALRWPLAPLGLLGALAVLAVVILFQLKVQYLPQFQERDFLMHWIAKPGTSIDVVRKDCEIISKEMRTETAVKEFGAHIARSEFGEEVVGPNFAELWVSLGEGDYDYETERKKIDDVMARHPGFEHDLLTYLQERIKEVLSGAGASIVVRTYGPDLATLRQKAQQVRSAIEGTGGAGKVAGVIDLRVESQVLVPQIELVLDPQRVAAVGLTPAQVVDSLATLINGSKVGEVHLDQKIFDVVVVGKPEARKSLPDLRRLEIDLPSGRGTVPLDALGELRLVNAPNTIRHDKASRCIDVTCNVSGGDLGGVVREIRERLKPLAQEEYRMEILGEYQALEENQRQLLATIALAILGVTLLLYLDFRSWKLTFLVLLTLPFALIGGVIAVYFTGGVLSLGSLVGFITVVGIAARNGIMMVSHYRHLEAEEKLPFDRELILRGAAERVSPVLMTALAAGLGLLPLALSGSKPGYEVEYPMAVVILGGLATSTLLNLLVLPVLYERLGRTALPAVEE